MVTVNSSSILILCILLHVHGPSIRSQALIGRIDENSSTPRTPKFVDSDNHEGEEQEILFPNWKKNSNGCGYSIDVETPSLAKLIRAVDMRLESGQSMVKVLEIGVGDSHVLANEFLNDIRVQITFVDPGSDFNAFPQRNESPFHYIQGYFPQDLVLNGCKHEKFDFVYSSRCIHCNTPQRMIDTIRSIREFLIPVHGRFILETTGINSGFYQQKPKLVDYFNERKYDAYPGLITETEFLKHWPEWTVGTVTLIDSSERLRNMLYEAGFKAIEYEEKYTMSNHEFFVIVGCNTEEIRA